MLRDCLPIRMVSGTITPMKYFSVKLLCLLCGYLFGSAFLIRPQQKSKKATYIKYSLALVGSALLSLICCYISYQTQIGKRFIPYAILGSILGVFFPFLKKLRLRVQRRLLRALFPFFLILINIYFTLVNGVLNAALIPAFMRELDAFREITVKSYSEQVQTDEIKENANTAISETKAWYKDSSRIKYAKRSDDDYQFIATYFPYPQTCSFDEQGAVIIPEGEVMSHNWVILLHGYTGWKEAMYEFAMFYSKQGYQVLCPDFRCSGESEGDFIGMGYLDAKDMRMWIDWILGQDPDANIVLHGQSMGASTALILSGMEDLPTNIRAIVSDAAYTDAYSMFGDKASSWFGLPPFPFVDSAALMLYLRGGYPLSEASPLKAVSHSSTPTLFIHGDQDAMISVSMCFELYEAASCEKQLLILEGSGHAQNQDRDPSLFYHTISSFLSTYVK